MEDWVSAVEFSNALLGGEEDSSSARWCGSEILLVVGTSLDPSVDSLSEAMENSNDKNINGKKRSK